MLTTVGFRTAGICAALALAVVGLSAQNAVPVEDVRARYTKYEYMVPMRHAACVPIGSAAVVDHGPG